MLKFFTRKRKKVGLALGSGAAKGLAHIGVLKALAENRVPIDLIAGSSIGAVVGACYAKTGEIYYLEELIKEVDWRRLAKMLDPNIALFFKGVIYGKKVKEFLRTIIGDVDFKDLKIPLSVVTTDAETGEEVVIKEGSVLEAVRASISVPAVFTPVKHGNRFLMDGGIIDPVPVDIVRKMGADYIIACNVIQVPKKEKKHYHLKPHHCTHPSGECPEGSLLKAWSEKIDDLIYENKDKINRMRKFFRMVRKKYSGADDLDPAVPTMFEAIIRTIYIMEYEIVQSKIKTADMIIYPDTKGISQVEFNRGEEAIAIGYKKTMEVLSKNHTAFWR